jgi:penicillin-binding protein 2
MSATSAYCAAVANALTYESLVRCAGSVLKPRRTVRGSPLGVGRVTVGPGPLACVAGVPAAFVEPPHATERQVKATTANASVTATIRFAGRGETMRGGVFLGAVLVGLLVGGLVAGVRVFNGRSSSTGAVAASTTAEQGSPRATADAFASAWTAGNTQALYLLLDPVSQHAHSLAEFTSAYADFESETTETTLQAHTTAARDGSATLAVKLTTAYFGDLEYTTALNLVRGPSGWLVSWDPSAIHPDLVNGRSIKSTIERPTRGAILDRNGVQLAITEDVRLLGINRSLVTDRPGLTATLVNFGFSQAQVDAAFNSSGGPQQRIPVGAVPDSRKEDAAGLIGASPGLVLYFQSERVHPLGAAAAHVVGYTRELTAEELAKRQGQGYRAGDRVGAIGIEASQEATLAGKIGARLQLFEADGTTAVKTYASQDYVAGKDVATTLDANVLKAAAARLGNRAGASVVMDPATNEVLAINSSPSFDPDAFERNDSAKLAAIIAQAGAPQTNRATTGLYSAGSTFKLITGAAGLVFGGATPSTQYECGATWDGDGTKRANWEGSQGELNISNGLRRSCNPVFYQIGLDLYNKDQDDLSKMARLFGFGAPTGIVGIGEEDGQVPDAAWKKAHNGQPWYPGDDVNLAIGQGDLLITPLQLANAYSSFLQNDLRTPVLIAGQPATDRGKLPLTPEQSAALKLGLKLVVGPTGTAAAAFANAGYTDFLGKSGTAEDAGAQSHVLFVAMSPAATPSVVCSVVLDEGKSGSDEAGPIARDIVLAALK